MENREESKFFYQHSSTWIQPCLKQCYLLDFSVKKANLHFNLHQSGLCFLAFSIIHSSTDAYICEHAALLLSYDLP